MSINTVIKMRLSHVHASNLLIVQLVDRLTRKTNEPAYITEVFHYYSEATRKLGYINCEYTHNGVGSMLRTMAKRGYLTGNGYTGYRVTPKGTELLRDIKL